MGARSTFTQADATRAPRAAVAAGLKPSGYRVDPATGAIEVLFGETPTTSHNPLDRVLPR